MEGASNPKKQAQQSQLQVPVVDEDPISPLRAQAANFLPSPEHDVSEEEADTYEIHPVLKHVRFVKGHMDDFINGRLGRVPTEVLRQFLVDLGVRFSKTLPRISLLALVHHHLEKALEMEIIVEPLCQRCYGEAVSPEYCKKHQNFCVSCNEENSSEHGPQYCKACDVDKNRPRELKNYLQQLDAGAIAFSSGDGLKKVTWIVLPKFRVPPLSDDNELMKHLGDDLINKNIERLSRHPKSLSQKLCQLNGLEETIVEMKESSDRAVVLSFIVRSRLPVMCNFCHDHPRATVLECGHNKCCINCLIDNDRKCRATGCSVKFPKEGAVTIKHIIV